MSGEDLNERLSRVGIEGWKAAVTRKAESYPEDLRAYQEWARSPRGRVVLTWRKIRNAPTTLRYRLAYLIYPGDLERERDDW